jgi:hypothetical protein
LKKHNVGAINWGVVSGKRQTIYPWGWDLTKGEPLVLFHDIFDGNGVKSLEGVKTPSKLFIIFNLLDLLRGCLTYNSII